MKEIKAIIQPFMLDDVHALEQIQGLPGLTLSDVRGWGRTGGQSSTDEASVREHRFGKKTKLEIVVLDDQVAQIADAITRVAHTGNPGDGKIFVYDVPEILRIRTGESGDVAI